MLEKIFFQKLSAISRDPSRAQILIDFSFNLCKNRLASSRINMVIFYMLNMSKKSEKKRGGEKGKSKSQDCCVTFMSKFCFLHMPELRKLIFCIWIRRP